MIKKILILFCGLWMLSINIVNAESISLEEVVKALKKSDLTANEVSQNHKVDIANMDNKLIITNECNNNKYETIFEYTNGTLTYSSNETKEILKENTIWIEEITRIVLQKFNYDKNTINNLNLSNLTFTNNGLEGVKNSYLKDGHEIDYYFYYKISLDHINLDKGEEKNEETTNDNSNEENSIKNEIKEDNTVAEEKKNKNNSNSLNGYTFYIEVFCMIIGVLMLMLNSATKK